MNGRPLLVSLAIVAVAAIVVASWILRGPHDSPSSALAPPLTERPASSPLEAPPASPSPPSSPLAAKRVASDQEDSEGERTAVDVTVVVTDADGVEHRKEDGSLVPWIRFSPSLEEDVRRLLDGDPLSRHRLDPVEVKAGRFHLELPVRPGRRQLTLEMKLGGRPALFDEGCDKAGLLEDAKSGVATLRAHWIECVRLHVVDAGSGRELDDVSIVGQRDVVRRLREIADGRRAVRDSYLPGRASALATLVEHGRSPLVVHPRFVEGSMEPFDEWFVHAPDHAWSRIDLHFDPSVGRTTDRTVELGPGATLVVDVQGELRPPRVTPSGERLVSMVRLRQETSLAGFPVRVLQNTIIAEEPAALGETRFESLEATAVTASIELGRFDEQPRVIASARAELAAGGSTRIAIVSPPEVVLPPVPLAGKLFVPAGWKLPDGRLLIRRSSRPDADEPETRDLPLSQMKPLPDRPGWFAWNAGAVPPGEYEFAVDAAGFAERETIAPPGNDRVEVTLADPAHLDVDVVDEATGQRVTLAWVAWSASHAETMKYRSSPIQLGYDPARKLFSGVVPVGDGTVCGPSGADWTFDEVHAAIRIHSGDQRLTVSVHRAIGVAVELWCGATRVPWSTSLVERCTVEALDDSGAPIDRALHDATLVVGVATPGRYRLTIPEIPGYAPVEPFEVNLPEGRFITRTIYLSKP